MAARGRRGEVGLGFAAPWGSCRGQEQVGRGPAAVVVRRACLCLSAGPTVTRTTVGATCSERGREGERGWAGCALRGRGTGPAHWLAWLPPGSFFLKPFFFSIFFSDF